MAIDIKNWQLPKTVESIDAATAGSATSLEKFSAAQAELIKRADAGQIGVRTTLNPFGPEARIQREARIAELTAKLDIFKDNLKSIVLSNRNFNIAAENAVRQAAEVFMMQVNTVAFVKKFEITNKGKMELMKILNVRLRDIAAMSEESPHALLEHEIDEAIARYMRKSAEIESATSVSLSAADGN